MKNKGMAIWLAAAGMLAAAPVFAQIESNEGQGSAIVTVMPKHEGSAPASVAKPAMSVKVNGTEAKVTSWTPYQGSANSLELVLLIDSSARNSLGSELSDIAHFVNSLPPNTVTAIAYMENGRAAFVGPLSADHAQVLRALHLPGGSIGSSASPYFCLSDLAKHWPSDNRQARREVLMVTDGVDNYERRYDPDDPYVLAAITDATRAGLVIYSIYWPSQGIADHFQYANNTGQNLLAEVSDATGGKSFWYGMGAPVSFEPYLDELTRRFRNQYELGFESPLHGKAQVENLKVKLRVPDEEVDSPKQVIVFPAGQTQQ